MSQKNTSPPPFFERQRGDYIDNHVSGDEFFQFFNKKRLKLIIAIIAGIVGVFGNFYAVRSLIEKTRFDMVGSEFARDFYAFGLTGMMDMLIILFHFMRIPMLTWTTTVVAISVALYANLNMIVMNQEVKDLGNMLTISSGTVSIMMASLPVIILTYLTHLVLQQYDYERAVIYRMRNEDEKSKVKVSTHTYDDFKPISSVPPFIKKNTVKGEEKPSSPPIINSWN